MRATGALVAVAAVGGVLWGGATRPPATWALALVGAAALVAALVETQRRGEQLRLAPLALPPLALALCAALQAVPLPPAVLATVAPAEAQVRQLVLDGGGWRPLSADAPATLNQVARLLGLAALAIAAAALGARRRRWLRAIGGGALAACLAVAAVVWLGVKLPEAIAPGGDLRPVVFPLRNPNHAAALCAMMLPLALVRALRTDGLTRLAWAGLLVAAHLGLVASASRSGIGLGLAAEVAVLVFLLRDDRRTATRVGAGLGFVALVALAIAGERLATKLTTMSRSVRWELARAAWQLVGDHALVGAGRGAFPSVFTRYGLDAGVIRYDFVENEYLQVLCDVGIAGTLVVAIAVAVALAMGRGRRRSEGARAALFGLGVLALQSVVDFAWEAGGVAAMASLLGALALPETGRVLRAGAALALAALTVLFLGLGVSPLGRGADVDLARLRSAAVDDALTATATAAFRRHPADGLLASVIADRLLDAGDAAAARWLDRALLLSPRDAQVHRIVARALALAGLREQAAAELGVALRLSDSSEGVYDDILALLPNDEDGAELAALPPSVHEQSRLISRLVAARRWAVIEEVGSRAVAFDEEPLILDALVRAAVERGDVAAMVRWGGHLAEQATRRKAPTSEFLLAARALEGAGQPEEAARLLDLARARDPVDGEVACAAARVALAQEDAGRAQTMLEEALAQAIDVQTKAQLHLALAQVAERQGKPNRAAFERATAARLSRK